jgi:hypothetical protein
MEHDDWSDLHAIIYGNYIAATHLLTAEGFADTLDVYGGTDPDFPTFKAKLSLNLKINDNGVGVDPLGPRSLTILPPALPPGFPTSPYFQPGVNLLTGLITDAQFSAPGVLEMLFDVTGGSAAGAFGDVGKIAALRIDLQGKNTPNPANFLANFTLGAKANASQMNIFGIPEPNSFFVFGGLALTSGALAYGSRQRKSQHSSLSG